MGSDATTAVMKSLADPTRRGVFETILRKPDITVGALVERFDVSQPAISQHLRELKGAGLLSERRDGRCVHYRVNPKGLAPLTDWIGVYAQFWEERFDNLEKRLREKENGP